MLKNNINPNNDLIDQSILFMSDLCILLATASGYLYLVDALLFGDDLAFAWSVKLLVAWFFFQFVQAIFTRFIEVDDQSKPLDDKVRNVTVLTILDNLAKGLGSVKKIFGFFKDDNADKKNKK